LRKYWIITSDVEKKDVYFTFYCYYLSYKMYNVKNLELHYQNKLKYSSFTVYCSCFKCPLSKITFSTLHLIIDPLFNSRVFSHDNFYSDSQTVLQLMICT